MFQTNTNCGNSSNVWNFNSLRSLLKIPQDQLNLLKNIPGWSNTDPTTEKTTTENKKLNPLQKSFAEQNKNSKATSSSSSFNQNIDCVKSKHISVLKNNTILEDLCNKHNFNKEISLRRSQSIDSIDKLQPVSNLPASKRTSSFPNMSKMLSLNSSYSGKQQNAFCTNTSDKISILGDNIGTTASNIMNTLYMDSGVQCQMSQSSQPNLEISLSKRIGLESNSTSSQNFVSNVLEREDVFIKTNLENVHIATKVSDSTPNEKVAEIEDSTLNFPPSGSRNCMLILQKPKDDESFVSLPIPCAQPQTFADKLVPKKQIPIPTENSTVPVNSLHANPLAKENNQLSLGKRKRRNDPDKVSKKVRSVKKIEVQYSEDQIKSMLHIIKKLNGL